MKQWGECSATLRSDVRARLLEFASLVQRWNRTVNLVSSGDEADLWRRHISDSLQLLPYLADAESIADLGSGAGFPGLVLAIASNRVVHLVEADHRKAAFLREAARVTHARVVVHAVRAENLRGLTFAAITARGLAPVSRLLELALPLLRPEGVCLFLKGRNLAAELTAADREWQMNVEQYPSVTDSESHILKLSRIRHVT